VQFEEPSDAHLAALAKTGGRPWVRKHYTAWLKNTVMRDIQFAMWVAIAEKCSGLPPPAEPTEEPQGEQVKREYVKYSMANRQYAVRVWDMKKRELGEVGAAKRATLDYLQDPLRHGDDFAKLKEQNLDAFADSVVAQKRRSEKAAEQNSKKEKDPRGRKPLLTAEQVCEATLMVKGINGCGTSLNAEQYRDLIAWKTGVDMSVTSVRTLLKEQMRLKFKVPDAGRWRRRMRVGGALPHCPSHLSHKGAAL
jgi:hypothetical protein